MAATASKLHKAVPGARYEGLWQIGFAAADYPNGGTAATNGYPITAALFGLNGLDYWAPVCAQLGGYIPVADFTNNRLHIYQCAGNGNPMTEVGANTDISGQSVVVMVKGW